MLLDAGIPSLDQLQWGRGLSTAEKQKPTDRQPLNQSLQWGRGLSTAEKIAAVLATEALAQASMGPRSFNRGKLYPPEIRAAAEKLQWGRGLSTAENAAHVKKKFPPARLQWGRGLSTAEKLLRTVWARPASGFNGAAVFQPRKKS